MTENILHQSCTLDLSLLHKIKRSVPLALLIWLSTAFLVNTEAQDGAALHENHCIACHAAMTGGDGSVLYTRDDRKVTSSDALTKQVNRCQTSLGLGWSNDQINSVQQFLHQTYYKF